MNILEIVGPSFEDSEAFYPYYRLQEEGYKVTLCGEEKIEYKGKHGVPLKADKTFKEVDMKDFDGLVIPGGHMPDKVRLNEDALKIVKDAFDLKKPVAVICHGGQIMINAKVVDGLKMTSVENIKADIENAGGEWQSDEVFVSDNLVSAQRPPHLPKWMKEFVAILKK